MKNWETTTKKIANIFEGNWKDILNVQDAFFISNANSIRDLLSIAFINPLRRTIVPRQ